MYEAIRVLESVHDITKSKFARLARSEMKLAGDFERHGFPDGAMWKQRALKHYEEAVGHGVEDRKGAADFDQLVPCIDR